MEYSFTAKVTFSWLKYSTARKFFPPGHVQERGWYWKTTILCIDVHGRYLNEYDVWDPSLRIGMTSTKKPKDQLIYHYQKNEDVPKAIWNILILMGLNKKSNNIGVDPSFVFCVNLSSWLFLNQKTLKMFDEL